MTMPPATLLSWLTTDTSLTDRLMKETGSAEVLLLNQGWEETDEWDRAHGIEEHNSFHRTILMTSNHTPCWLARTSVPYETYHARTEFFDRLQSESLGVLLFHERTANRVAMRWFSLSLAALEFHWILPYCNPRETTVWARESEWRLIPDALAPLHPEARKSQLGQTYSFFLIEIFLPGLLCCTKN